MADSIPNKGSHKESAEASQRLVGLLREQITDIQNLGALIRPRFKAIADQFYDHIDSFPELRRIIGANTTVDRLKLTFEMYLGRLFAGTYDETYQSHRTQVGLTHARVQLPLKYYLSMFGHLEVLIARELKPHFESRPLQDWIDASTTLSKVIRYDQLLAVDSYVEAYTISLQEERRAADQARKSKTLFLAKVSHELRTPLSSILGYTELILDRSGEISETTRKHLGVLNRNASNLLSMINGLIDIGRADSERWVTAPSLKAPASLIDDMALNAEGLIGRRPIEVHREATADLQKPVRLDFAKLRQIMLNLVSNACKYTSAGSITIAGHTEGGFLIFKVSDTGIGIPEAERATVFDEFYRASNQDSEKTEGHGLGLTLVKTLVEHLGGTIEIEGNQPRGTVFIVRVPFS